MTIDSALWLARFWVDDLCHSGSQTLCGIWEEELAADADDDGFDEEYPDDHWGEVAE